MTFVVRGFPAILRLSPLLLFAGVDRGSGWWPGVKWRLAVLLDNRIADEENLVQSIGLRFGDTQNEEPTGILEVGNPFEASESNVKT